MAHTLIDGDHVFNTCERIRRARDAIVDVPLDVFDRKILDDWLLAIRGMPSKHDGKSLGATTIRTLTSAIRVALKRFIGWGWWTPQLLWEEASKKYTIKKLHTPSERKRRRKRPATHSVTEKRILWHLTVPFGKAMMALADWAGHTQKEIATLTFDDIVDVDGEMFIDRDRHKTGVHAATPSRSKAKRNVACVQTSTFDSL